MCQKSDFFYELMSLVLGILRKDFNSSMKSLVKKQDMKMGQHT